MIRTWRPSVVICDAADPDDRAAQLVHAAIGKATRYAAAPTRLSVRSSLCGLTPWTVRRRFDRTDGDVAAVVRVDSQTALSRSGEVVGTLVHRSLLGRTQDDMLDWQGDRLKRLEGSGRANGDSACQGLGLAQGSAARRDLSKIEGRDRTRAEAQFRRSRALDAWVRLAESGTRPQESLAAELMPLLQSMDDHRGGWSLWRLSERFRSTGRLPLAETLLTELVDRFRAGGADAMILEVTDKIDAARPKHSVKRWLASGRNDLEYNSYLKWRGVLPFEPPRRPDPARPAAPPMQRGEGWKYGFIGARCTSCGSANLPPQRVCVVCGALDQMEDEAFADAECKIATFTLDRRAYSLQPPVIAAVVDFEKGGRINCQLTDVDPDAVAIGDELEMTFRKMYTADGVHNYFWKARPLR